MDRFGSGSWSPRREGVVDSWAELPEVGPYTVGPVVRVGPRGLTRLAAHPDREDLLELEHYTALAATVQRDLDGALMQDLARASAVRHRHLADVHGVGLLDGAPYVVRSHCPGRTLAAALDRGPLEPAAAAGVLYSVAEALVALVEQGNRPEACAMGGFDAEDVLLGFDGGVFLIGTGLKRARGPGDTPLEADLAALRSLARALWPALELVEAQPDVAAWALALRKRYPDACGLRSVNVARTLRARFDEAIPRERALLGLPTLH